MKNAALPLVSIVTVTFNAEKFIEQCINSVKAQAYPNIEHLIIDGKSTDNTLNILNKNSSNIIRWISEPDNGIYDAMNKGTKLSHGQWILFLGADDILLDGFSEMCYLLKEPNVIYYGESLINNDVMGGEFNAHRLSKFNICHQSIFYPKKAFEKYQYNLNYKVRADHDLNIRCFADPELKFQYFPIKVSRYADGGFSSAYEDKAFFKDRANIIKHNFGFRIHILYLFRRLRHRLKGRKS